MKDVLIIFSHPDRKRSVNALILSAFIKGLKDQKKSFTVLDLYGLSFNPVFSLRELREGHLDRQTKRHHKLIKNHHALVFICPGWNYGIPAILKGWIDRILVIPQFSFKEDEYHRYCGGLLTHHKALVIQTLGGVFDSKQKKEAKQLDFYLGPLESILKYIGVENIETHHFFHLYNVVSQPHLLVNLEKKSYQFGLNF